MVPHTRDGRVMFAIPWHGHAVVGTTDTPDHRGHRSNRGRCREEIDFILETASGYLARAARARADILSVFTGIRPLVKAGDAGNTAALSRDHTIQISKSGLLTIAGGKWTTYRRMAEDCVNHAATLAGLDERPCVTRDLRIHGYHPSAAQFGALRRLRRRRARAAGLDRRPPELDAVLDAGAADPRGAGLLGASATRWRGPWTTCWRGGRGRCRSNARAAMRHGARRWRALMAAETGPRRGVAAAAGRGIHRHRRKVPSRYERLTWLS